MIRWDFHLGKSTVGCLWAIRYNLESNCSLGLLFKNFRKTSSYLSQDVLLSVHDGGVKMTGTDPALNRGGLHVCGMCHPVQDGQLLDLCLLLWGYCQTSVSIALGLLSNPYHFSRWGFEAVKQCRMFNF